MNDLFKHIENVTNGEVSAAEMRTGCRNWLIIFAIAITAIVIAGYSIYRQLN